MKSKGRGRPSKGLSKINKELIIEKVKHLLEVEGKVPSIRKLAEHLNVDGMAIYHYFKSKKVLLEATTVSLIESIHLPKESEAWEAELIKLSLSYLRLLDKYGGLLETLFTMDSHSPAHVFIGRFNTILESLSLDEQTKTLSLHLLADYLHGFAYAKIHDKHNLLSIEDAIPVLEFYFKSIKTHLN